MAVILLLSVNAFFLEVEFVNFISLQSSDILLDDGVKMSHFVYWQITKKTLKLFLLIFWCKILSCQELRRCWGTEEVSVSCIFVCVISFKGLSHSTWTFWVDFSKFDYLDHIFNAQYCNDQKYL